MGHPVRINGNRVAEALEMRSREPFVKELARWFVAGPSSEAIRRMAEKRPDRWVQAIAVLAKLAGYNDRTESVNLNMFANIKNMSDAELTARVAELQRKLAAFESPGAEADKNSPDQPHS